MSDTQAIEADVCAAVVARQSKFPDAPWHTNKQQEMPPSQTGGGKSAQNTSGETSNVPAPSATTTKKRKCITAIWEEGRVRYKISPSRFVRHIDFDQK